MDQSSNGTIGTFKKLDSKDKETLALLKGTPVYEVLVRAIDISQKDKANLSFAASPNWEHVLQTRGEVQGMMFIIKLIDYISEAQEKAIKAKKAIET